MPRPLELAAPQPATPGAVTTTLLEGLDHLDPHRLASGVGVGVPGPVDRGGRVAQLAINLPGWRDVPLADWLEAQQERPVTMANDANCAALGELWLGAGRGTQDLLLLCLGTGVGGAVILGGKLLTGRLGVAVEPGLILLDPSGPPATGGNHGSLEQHCSIAALKRPLGPWSLPSWRSAPPSRRKRPSPIGKPTDAVWGWGSRRWPIFLHRSASFWGGGIAGALPYFRTGLEQELQRRLLPMFSSRYGRSTLCIGNGAGRAGAARLALDRLGGSPG